ncbi:hypothetical protein TanjilG_22658 [Lupinus angustifolius]|uniref:Uncharacterized protein n=2 Tax=Lupinus angustifolius TaxID=3871 RepID=A0A4P1RTB0_LUPAN|nr:hypothetical protein TanjilG_22658 [Lupinus angustifolius]
MDVGKLLREVPKEIEEINEELEIIQASINAADRMTATAEEEVNIGDIGMKRNVKHMRVAALRIKEVIEDYTIIQQQQPQSDLGCIAVLYAIANFVKTMIPRLRISYEIQDIKSSIRQINERSCFVKGSSSGSQNVPPHHALRTNALYAEEDDVVGFEIPRDNMIGWLKKERLDRSVIAVVGMGGQGKTTLAKIVYEKVKRDFDCYAWITVSQVYTIEGLLRTMWEKFGENKKEASRMDQESLTEKVREYLGQKRYVVFFDDVWKKSFWTDIESIVFDNKKKSRIVITSRRKDVARLCKKTSLYTLKLRPLSQQQSFELFWKKAFQNEPDGLCPTHLQDISSKIVEKCEGLPLAIVAIGGLLAGEENNSCEWQKLCRSVVNELDKYPNSYGITNILGLSYDVLPYYLKPCFLYFGIYPKDYEVNYKRLIRLWIGEGFVPLDKKFGTLEEVGEQYLKELVQRNLVQVSSFSIDGKPKSYRVHDLLHDIIITKIKDSKFCHFLGKDVLSIYDTSIQRIQIGIYCNNDDFLKINNYGGTSITSIHILGDEGIRKEFPRIIPQKYKRLKVVDYNWVDNIPEYFVHSYHLRYLRFSGGVNSLPTSIGNLVNLETLDLKWTNVKELPIEINKLRKLRHLLLPMSRLIGGIGGLESLQTLHCVDTRGWNEYEIGKLGDLMQLRSLGLMNLEGKYVSIFCSTIKKLKYLEKLYIHATGTNTNWDITLLPTLQRLKLEGKLEMFSEWIPKYQNLVRLSLTFSKLNDPMKSLEHLPNLLSLHLWDAYDGITLHFENGMFQKLKNLDLIRLKSLNSIHIGEGALPSLKQLTLQDIPNLGKVPSGMDNLRNLEVLWIKEMPEEFVNGIRKNVCIHNNSIHNNSIDNDFIHNNSIRNNSIDNDYIHNNSIHNNSIDNDYIHNNRWKSSLLMHVSKIGLQHFRADQGQSSYSSYNYF